MSMFTKVKNKFNKPKLQNTFLNEFYSIGPWFGAVTLTKTTLSITIKKSED